MKPTITISDMTLNIRLDDILAGLSTEQRLELIRMVAMDEPLIQDIVDQLADGWTEDGSSVGEKFLNKARMKLMPLMGEVAKEAVRRLAHERDFAVAEAERHREWAWKLFHAWPRDASRINIPAIPDRPIPRSMTDEEARFIADVAKPDDR